MFRAIILSTHDVAGHRPATSWVHYTTSCNTQSSAPEDGQNDCPKHVELIGIINKPLLLHLVGSLYYLQIYLLFWWYCVAWHHPVCCYGPFLLLFIIRVSDNTNSGLYLQYNIGGSFNSTKVTVTLNGFQFVSALSSDVVNSVRNLHNMGRFHPFYRPRSRGIALLYF